MAPRPLRIALLVSLLAVLFAAREAAAQAEYGARAVLQRPRLSAPHGEDPTASGTSIDLVDRVSLPRSLGEVVREAPGARVQSSGGLGAFSSVSLRGADGDETQVMLDEIPLTAPDGGAFDLSLLPAELFARVDVFRGGAPVWLGSGAIGGVLRLVPRRDAQNRANAASGVGSFGLFQLHGGASAGTDDVARVRSHVVVRRARNDYPYWDEKGTLYDPTDDEELRRKNAELTDASAFTDLTVALGRGQLHVIALAHGRTGGYPGPGSQPTPNVHRSNMRGLLGVSYERRWGSRRLPPRRRVQLVASTSYELSRYTDLFGELGRSLRWDTNDRSYRGFLRLAATERLTRWLEATITGAYALDHYAWQNRFTFPKPAPSTRHTASTAFELAARGNLGRVGFELRPSARVEWSVTELHASRGVEGDFHNRRHVTIPTARVGAGVLPLEDLALTGSIATGGRLPTMHELFGNRGMVLPTPGLKPVSSVSYDVGVAYCTSQDSFRVSSELHAFLQERRDAIAAFGTPQSQVGHENLSQVEQRGVELGLSGSVRDTFSLHSSLTYLHTENQLQKRLPLKPQWVFFARPEATVRFTHGPVSSASAAAEVYLRSFVFADRANLAVVPQCRTVGLGFALGFLRERVRLTTRVEDSADVRCNDLVGYPLPGRSLFFSVSFQEDIHDHT